MFLLKVDSLGVSKPFSSFSSLDGANSPSDALDRVSTLLKCTGIEYEVESLKRQIREVNLPCNKSWADEATGRGGLAREECRDFL